jgi:hypothetical protein
MSLLSVILWSGYGKKLREKLDLRLYRILLLRPVEENWLTAKISKRVKWVLEGLEEGFEI